MKIPKAEFARFKKKFLEMQDILGLRGYKVYFEFGSLKDSHAMITINQTGAVCSVTYNNETLENNSVDRPSPEECATHETIHLLISKLSWLGRERYLNCGEIHSEEESIVRVLEKIL